MSKEDKDSKVITRTFDISKSIKIHYENENAFNKLSKSLKMYNMLAYKDFIFNLMHQLRTGKVVGYEIEPGLFRCDLQSNQIFEFVYGKVYFTYKIENNNAILLDMEPKSFLLEGHSRQLPTYKGVPITGPKDRFKIDLYFSIDKEK